MKRILVIGIVLAGLLAGTANAEDTEAPAVLPTVGAVHLPMIESLEPVAEAYWDARGIALPGPVEVFVIPDDPSAMAFGESPGDRVWLTEGLVSERGEFPRYWLCEAYLHERGHNAGLQHSPPGHGFLVMLPHTSTEHPGGIWIPRCNTWAHSGFKVALDP